LRTSSVETVPRPNKAPVLATANYNLNYVPPNLEHLKGSSDGQDKLSKKFRDALLKGDAAPRYSTGKSKSSFRFLPSWLTKSKSREEAAKLFGLPLGRLPKGQESGVPEVLDRLREQLWAQDGHLCEGIFRVSAEAQTLKSCRQAAEEGQWDRVRSLQSPESVAQLIKIWFKELPESIFDAKDQPAVLDQIVDAAPTTGGASERYQSAQAPSHPSRPSLHTSLHTLSPSLAATSSLPRPLPPRRS